MNHSYSLRQLGWQPFYQQQLSLEEFENMFFGRITSQHRNSYIVQLEEKSIALPVTPSLPHMAVGDWVLLNKQFHFIRLLERKSLFARKAAGNTVKQQYIAANVDTLFVVMSLNQDFNLNRLERYLALANESHVEPVVLLTKSDLCIDVDEKLAQVQELDPMISVIALNGLDENAPELLTPWCKPPSTVAFVGSSGVGKSTLINTLFGEKAAATGGIREDDDKGKHTTTSRNLFISPEHGAIIDTPGMRELRIFGSKESLNNAFSDIEMLAQHCRFKDCTHTSEPGCTVLQAIDDQRITQRRLVSYQKLLREQAHNNASLKEQRDKDRQFGKFVKKALNERKRQKDS